jgi:hypothetical protein
LKPSLVEVTGSGEILNMQEAMGIIWKRCANCGLKGNMNYSRSHR